MKKEDLMIFLDKLPNGRGVKISFPCEGLDTRIYLSLTNSEAIELADKLRGVAEGVEGAP